MSILSLFGKRGVLALAAGAGLAASAETWYFDTNGAEPGFGTADGDWTSAFWTQDATGSAVPGGHATVFSDAVQFGTEGYPMAGGAVSVDGQQSVGAVAFAGSGAITLGGTGPLVLADRSEIRVNEYCDATVSVPLVCGSSLEIWNGKHNLTLSGTMQGEGAELSSGIGRIDCFYGLSAESDWAVCAFDARLASVTNLTGLICGAYMGDEVKGQPGRVYFFENNGSEAACQVQIIENVDYLKCILIELRQNGDNIEIRSPWAGYRMYADYGYCFRADGTVPEEVQSTTGINGYGVNQITLKGLQPASGTVTQTGSNEIVGGTLSVYGRHHVIANANGLPPNGVADVYSGAALELNVVGEDYRTGISGGTTALHVHKGGTIRLNASECLGSVSRQELVVDGGKIDYKVDVAVIFNNVTLRNGASFVNYGGHYNGIWLGANRSEEVTWTIDGESPSSCVVDMRPMGAPNGWDSVYDANHFTNITFIVKKTTDTDASDFVQQGRVMNFNDAADGYRYANIIKRGTGTMELAGGMTAELYGSFRIQEGVLKIGRSDGYTASTAVSLEGGALAVADGTSNAIANVRVACNSALKLGAGAVLRLNSLAFAEGAGLDIQGDLEASALYVPRLGIARHLVTCNGQPVHREPDGRLHMGALGSLMILR